MGIVARRLLNYVKSERNGENEIENVIRIDSSYTRI